MRLFVSLSYDGAPFCGWQSQRNAPSVQDELERALSIVFGGKIAVVGAGRTDSGVNARNYIAHFDVSNDSAFESGTALCKLNAILPAGICVHGLFKVADDAHARFDAVSRTYKYYVHTAKDPFAVKSLLVRYKLDVEKMNRAASLLLGTRDFSSFEKVGSDNKTSICTVTEAFWTRLDDTHLVFTISANRFLRNMVRATVGTLLEIGGGKHPEEWILDVLAARDRCSAGQSVPGDALFLDSILYPYPFLPFS